MREAAEQMDEQPTAFELITAAALLHFAQVGCTAVVLEVGLGGRLDSTNVVVPEVCAITSIALTIARAWRHHRQNRARKGRHHQSRHSRGELQAEA